MSQTKNEANAATQTALAAVQTVENTQFIANVDAQILQAQALGQFEVSATATYQVDIPTVYNYYAALGYAVWLPDINHQYWYGDIPAGLFGVFWNDYWAGNYPLLRHKKTPLRMIIAWRQNPVNY